MLLKIDKDLILHKRTCNVATHARAPDYYGDWYCDDEEDSDCAGRVHARETVCLLSRSNGLVYLTSPSGKVGCARVPWWKIYIWRLNTVVIKDFKTWNGEDLSVAVFLLALVTAVCIGAFCLIKTVTASGLVDSCVVREYEKANEHTGPMYILEGHRSWRSDAPLLITGHREEAEAKKLEICPR